MDAPVTTWISCRAYAKHRGCTPMAVSLAIKAGRLSPPAVVYVGGQPKIGDVALADEQWDRNTDPVRQENANKQGTTAGPAEPVAPRVDADDEEIEGAGTATERLKSAQADLAELKRDALAGELVKAADVRKKLEEVFSACKTRLLAIPSRARQALPHMANDDVVEIEALIREALEELAVST